MSGVNQFAPEYVFELYSEAKLLAEFAEYAHQCMVEKNPNEALATLMRARERYGDLFGIRMRFYDAVTALGGESSL